MPVDGNGTYTPLAPEYPAITDTVISSADYNAILLDIAQALSTAIFRDGQAAFTANQSMGTFKLTNLGNGANPQDAVTYLQVFTDPTFTGVAGFGVVIAGTKLTVTAGLCTLPANTTIGNVSAASLALLEGLTASAAELNILDGATLSTAELNLLDGVTATTAQINYLTTTTSNVQAQFDNITGTLLPAKAPLASPALTGTPTAPTAAVGTNTTQIATMAALLAQAFTAALPLQAGNAGKFVTTDGANASWADVPQFPLTAMSVI